jgi:hypothetical protein
MQRFALAVLISVSLPLSSFAGTHKVPQEKTIATVTLPDAWKANDYDEGVEVNSDDGEVYLAVEATDAKGVKASMEAAMKYLTKKGVTVDADSAKQEEGKLNGMEAVDISWDGKDDEGAAKISLTVIEISGNKALLLIYWASPDGEKKHLEELHKIAQSIKKA